ncbi:MgtC/SapB family protein [Selenomonas sp. WCT3]|uniref:MgtC/SapB family protein n=1 Tax=Selenomonas sp. WCT3 TaxID=3158785 RepID=UPI000942FC87
MSSLVSDGELFFRLVLACVLGGVIGYERQSRRKSAGLRTNMLVCLGSCLVMVLSQALYREVEGLTNADPARLAAQVVSGIGFLGAGAIMKEGLTVTGLTTAACLWVVAGVGLAVGAGFYSGALIATALVFVTLGSLSRLDEWVDHEKNFVLSIHTVDKPGQVMKISSCLEDLQLRIRGIKLKADEDEVDLSGERLLYINLEIYNKQGVKGVIIVDAVRQIDGVHSVDIS